jgi:hypothetical protein
MLITITTLSLLLGFALWSAKPGQPALAAAAVNYPLDPNGFTSLGASPFSAAGVYTIDASKNNANPILTKPDSTTITGVFYSPSGGMVAKDEIAVFTFNSLNIPAGVTALGARNANSRPIALLSQSTVTIAGTIDVSGANGANNSGINGGNGGNAGPGGGGGGGAAAYTFGTPGSGGVGFVNGANGGIPVGANGGSVVAGGGGTSGPTLTDGGGGAFGGNGGNGGAPGFGGTAYGDLTMTLQGGSGGASGASGVGAGGGGGGGGGGAIELGALGNITLSGTVLANGGAGGSGFGTGAGGGGAGGGIVVHGPAVSLSGNLNAIGGAGSGYNGGGGGGGRVLILTAGGTLADGSLAANVNVNGGGNLLGPSGQPGVKELGIGDFPNQAPIARCQNVTVSAGSNCTASVTAAQVDDGSYDPGGDSISLSLSPAGPFGLGSHTVELTVTDSNGASSSCTATVTVVDNTAPTITLYGANPMTVECPYGFVDPGATATDNCAASVAVTTSGSVNTAVPGSYTITYSADDGHGNIATKTRTVNVVDTTPPTLTLKPDIQLWPPNHKYQTVTMSQMVQSVSDGCNAALSLNDVRIEKVTSDEPDNAPGDADGNTTNDILIAADCKSVQLRSERDEKKNGRVYVVTLRLRDASGNTTRAVFKVSVPINQSGAAAVQDATALTRTSSCP